MNSCEEFQSLFLDLLYGLLDGSDEASLRRHLADCPACRAAMTRAEDQKRLLAAAAKGDFPGLTFAPPDTTAAAAHRQPSATPPLAHGHGRSGRAVLSGRRVRWPRWAVAASLLVAAGGGLVTAANGYRQQRARFAIAEARERETEQAAAQLAWSHAAKRAAVEADLRAAREEQHKLPPRVADRLVNLGQSLSNQSLYLSVSGPPTVEAGAVNDFQVLVCDRVNRPVAASVTAELVDARSLKRLAELVATPGSAPGTNRLSLPRDLPIRPDSDLHLVVCAKGPGVQGELTEKLKLVAPVYLTHLATDKPMYQPGEIVYFRSLTLERFSLKPAAEELQLSYAMTTPLGEVQPVLAGPARVGDAQNGAALRGPDKMPLRGVGAGEYVLDDGAPGGEYTLTVSEANGRFPPQQRKFLVNRYEKPRLNKELEFTKKSYGPGDAVVAACRAARAEGGAAVARQPVSAAVKIDGQTVYTLPLRTDTVGGVTVKFSLPTRIERGDATLAVSFTDGGSVETIVRPIPIVLKKLQIEFFPEGGDLVAGVPNRVYFQARTTLDKPAEVQGEIIDRSGSVVARAETLNEPTQPGANQGMGRFEFTPGADQRYELRVTSPEGVEGHYVLPAAKHDGVVLAVPTGVTADREPIRVRVCSAEKSRRLLVGAYCRGRLMAHERIAATPGRTADLDLRPESGVGGVYRVTVFEEERAGDGPVRLTPRAERLVYRTPAHRLSLRVQPDKPVYVPGESVTLRYAATDEKGKPAPAVLMVAAVDQSVLKLADEKTFRNMPTHFLLTTEVRRPEDLEYADFLLGEHPKALAALDLLLGSQGWRRFVEQHDPDEFRRRNVEEANRLMIAEGRMTPTLEPQTTNSAYQAVQEAYADYSSQAVALQDRISQAEARLADVEAEGDALGEEVAKIRAEVAAFSRERQEARGELARYQTLAQEIVLPGVAVFLGATCLVSLALALFRKKGARLQYGLVAGCSAALLAIIVVWGMRPGPNSWLVAQEMNGISPGAALSPSSPPPEAADPTEPDYRFTPEGTTAGGGADLKKGKDEEARKPDVFPPYKAPAGRAGVSGDAAKGEMVPRRLPAPAGATDKGDKGSGVPGQANAKNRIIGYAGGKEVQERPADQAAAGKDRPGVALKRQKPANLAMGRALQKGLQEQEAQHDRDVGRKVFANKAAPTATPAQALELAGAAPFGGKAADFRRRLDPSESARAIWDQVRAGQIPFDEPPPPLMVREFAHEHLTVAADVRSDAAETVYWHPVLVLPDGKGESKFNLSDSVTTIQVLAAGNTLDGRLGSVTAELPVRKPLTVEPKLPVEVTANDRVDVPVAVANGTGSTQTVSVGIQATNLTRPQSPGRAPLSLAANGRTRQVYGCQPTIAEGEGRLQIDARAGAFSDRVERSFKIVPDGFPVGGTQSDLLENVARHEPVLPESWILGTLRYQVAVYPSTLADLQKGLEGLLGEPNGCFEQTSTTNYPNLLILDYLRETDQAKPEVARRAQELLGRGYQRLTSFECLNTAKNQREGYEWFGGTAPAHEALTAYGLMQFRDMARVYDVDQGMVERTRTYLMARRDGKGGFQRNPRAIDTFGRAPENVTNAYIVWALTESGKDDDLTAELNALASQTKDSTDPYFLALAANAFLNRDLVEPAQHALAKLVESQRPDGHLDAAATSITGSGGRDLQIETTALSLLAWLKAKRPDQFNVPTQKAVKWMGQQRGGTGSFGSTQATILTLKALIAYAKANKKTAEAGELICSIDGRVVGRQAFPAGTEEAIVLEVSEPEKLLRPGKNEIAVELTGKNALPYTASWSCRSVKPVSAEKCQVGLRTTLDRATANEGDTVGLSVEVENKSDKGQGMTVAIVGLPGGLTLPEDMKQLKDLARLRNDGTERGPIDAWEVRGRELVLYWRDMAQGKKVEVSLELICRVPGAYRGPASRAYLYYNAEEKCWVEPLRVEIKAKVD
jgi:hypothetical protein